ncbi:hypothetical protein F2P46_03485 [Massilia sp. CCM 8734]|nr:hypothetical protein [Massilia sp. CCM 8734]
MLPADGTCFQCLRYGAISPILESEFAQWLTTAIKICAFDSKGQESGMVRFCFTKEDDTWRLALERLARL